MIQAFRFIEISKYDDGGQLTTRGQLMQGSSTLVQSAFGKHDVLIIEILYDFYGSYNTSFLLS